MRHLLIFIIGLILLSHAWSETNDGPVDFELAGLDGQTYRLSSFRGDQWVVVNYWATWCAPCRKEIPDLSQLHDSRDDVTVLGLAFEEATIDEFEAFLTDYPASYPILLVDTFNPPESLGAPRALPTTYLINPEGFSVEVWLGPVTSEMIIDRIDELLAPN